MQYLRSIFLKPFPQCNLLRPSYLHPQGNWLLFGLFFMLSNSYRFDLHNKLCATLTKSTMKHPKNQIENHTSPNLVMIIGSDHILFDFLIGYIGTSMIIQSMRNLHFDKEWRYSHELRKWWGQWLRYGLHLDLLSHLVLIVCFHILGAVA
jgi:hypothetical protein